MLRTELRLKLCLAAFGVGSPVICAAAVMDGEPALATVWILGVLGGLAGLLALRVRWWLFVVTLPIPLLFFLAMLAEVSSPEYGPAIRAETGNTYVFAVYAGSILVLAGHVVGLLWGWRLRRARRDRAPESGL